MLIIPFDRRIDWHHPPWMTLSLVAINLLVFFLFQTHDDEYLLDALGYQYRSGLAALELPHYRGYLKTRSESTANWPSAEPDPSLSVTEIPSLEVQLRMLLDSGFQHRLGSDRVIVRADPVYQEWQSMREEFQRRLDRSLSYRWGFKTAAPAPWPAFASLFLHASTLHVLGNMFFLVALGFLVEYTLGAGWFLALYLLSGLGATGLYWLLDSASLSSGVGASGAIAGLMGLYTVSFGFRPVRFFYFVWIYFDYIRAPAIALLPFWLGYEIYQYVLLADQSHVNYAAHMGGILSGALLALAAKRLPGATRQDYLDKNPGKARDYTHQLDQAQRLLDELRPEKALPLFEAILREHPHERRALVGRYRATRFTPGADAYHRAATAILALRDADAATLRLILETFREYIEKAKPAPRLDEALALRLTGRFLATGQLAEAARLIALGLRTQRPSTRLVEQGRSLARHWQQQGEGRRAERLQSVLNRIQATQTDKPER